MAGRIADCAAERGADIRYEDLVIGGTHTHSGPILGKYFYCSEVDEEYLALVAERTGVAIAEACRDEGEEVELYYSELWIDGLYSNRNDRNKLSDKRVQLLGFFHEGKAVGILCNLAHHGTVLGPDNMQVSGDLMGAMRPYLEKEFQAPVFMSQGNAGDMGNKQYRNGNDFEALSGQAWNICDQIRKKHKAWEKIETQNFKMQEHHYKLVYDIDIEPLKVRKAEFEEKLKTEKNADTIKLLLTAVSCYEKKIEQGSGHVEKDMHFRIVTLGELVMILIPGEMGSILGMRIKEASPAKETILWGYVNPFDLGYMIEKEAYREFSQEANTTEYPEGAMDKFADYIISRLLIK